MGEREKPSPHAFLLEGLSFFLDAVQRRNSLDEVATAKRGLCSEVDGPNRLWVEGEKAILLPSSENFSAFRCRQAEFECN